jgi:UPF0176 protein
LNKINDSDIYKYSTTFKNPFSHHISMQKVILFYKFAKVDKPVEFVEEQRGFCQAHNLLGRIIISGEGINATLAGDAADIEAYKTMMHAIPAFKDTWFKEQEIAHKPFPRLQCRYREELVTLRAGDLPIEQGGAHLSPSQVNEMANDPDVVFLDARNEIESRIGKFKDAITPNIKTFRDFPTVVEDLKGLKDKKIITYCTGGIRCEKATVLLKNAGFKNVYQIDGGIYNYCQQFPNGHFQGTCFVFDDRMQIGWGNDKAVKLEQEVPLDKVISHCEFCQIKTPRVVNDERILERKLIVCCTDCDTKLDISRLRTTQERVKIKASAIN